MSRNGKSRRPAKHPKDLRPQKSVVKRGRDILRFEEHFKIAPKHPGMGRR